jgi:hypothetical protein
MLRQCVGLSIMTSCAPRPAIAWYGESARRRISLTLARAGNLLGTTLTLQPGESARVEPSRYARTSGGVSASWPAQKGQGSSKFDLIVGAVALGLLLRSLAMMTHRSTTGSFLNSDMDVLVASRKYHIQNIRCIAAESDFCKISQLLSSSRPGPGADCRSFTVGCLRAQAHFSVPRDMCLQSPAGWASRAVSAGNPWRRNKFRKSLCGWHRAGYAGPSEIAFRVRQKNSAVLH